MKTTAEDMCRLLRETLDPAAHALFFEVANGTGSNARRHMDAVSMSLWPSRGLDLTAYEIKVSRTDWKRELANPAKAESIAKYCDFMVVVVPNEAIIHDGELPRGWGLMTPKKRGSGLVTRVKPDRLSVSPVPDSHRGFVASLLRHAGKVEQRAAEASLRTARAEVQGQLKANSEELFELRRVSRDLERLRKTVQSFEDASGVKISQSWQTEKIGEAVRLVMKHNQGPTLERLVDRIKRQMEHNAEELRKQAAEIERVVGVMDEGVQGAA